MRKDAVVYITRYYGMLVNYYQFVLFLYSPPENSLPLRRHLTPMLKEIFFIAKNVSKMNFYAVLSKTLMYNYY